MRKRIFIIVSVVLFTELYGRWKLVNVHPIITEEEKIQTRGAIIPQWLDEKRIIFRGGKWRGVYIKNADGKGKLIKYKKPCKIKIDGKNLVFGGRKKLSFFVTPFLVSERIYKIIESTGSILLNIVKDTFILRGKEKIWFFDTLGNFIDTIKFVRGSVSPDGKKIAYIEDGKIIVEDIKTKKKMLKESVSSKMGKIEWAPNGKRFFLNLGVKRHSYIFDIETGKRYLVDIGKFRRSGWIESDWLPDGEWLIYNIIEDNGFDVIASELWITKWDGSEKTCLIANLVILDHAVSPDGTQITFVNHKDGKIYVGKLIKE